MAQVTQAYLDKLIKNSAHFYSAMLQNQYYLPKAGMKSPFCTVKLFKEVVTDVSWLPKLPKFKYCQNPPLITDLLDLISDGILTINGEGQEEKKRKYVRFLYHIK